MSDQISRQKLIEEYYDKIVGGYDQGCLHKDCERAELLGENCIECVMRRTGELIESQPPAGQWIPCSDTRKPADGQTVVVTVDLFGKWTHIGTATYHTKTPKGWWEHEWEGEGFYQSHECGWCRREDVTAWFYTEPYKGVE